MTGGDAMPGIAGAERLEFARVFGTAPLVAAEAAGRVNLLGEHTDYNEGLVLPTPLACSTRVYAAHGSGGIEAYAERFDARAARAPRAPRDGTWMDYVAACAAALEDEGIRLSGARLYLRRGVPPESGLASSAALEVAVLRALRALFGLPIDDLRLALLAHRAETEYVGVRCGVMDQIVSSLGRVGQALLLDTRGLALEHIPIPGGHRFVVIDSGVPRRLAEAGYNQRRSECEQAAARLGVRSLRDLDDTHLPRAAMLPEPLGRRARHVVTENARVLAGVDALRSQDMPAFGRLMSESHRSLRDDYDVSTPELDRLVEAALALGACGARLTGAGFGGCLLVLCPDAAHEELTGRLIRDHVPARIVTQVPASLPIGGNHLRDGEV
jgi:galactokinase